MNQKTLSVDLTIGGIHINPPIIQGGMGVAISLSRLAAAVSNAGGLGVVAAVGASRHCQEPNLSYKERSYLGLRTILQETKARTDRPFGVNIMCALSDYNELVRAAVEENVAVIISGAGLPLHLPELTGTSPAKLIPIVSSARAASIICRTWQKKYHRLPDAFIVEGCNAGGHIGFSSNEILQRPTLESIVTDVVEYVKSVEREYSCTIPVIAAGGIFSGTDIARFLKLGAAGVQMGTRFVCTDECDADQSFKEAYIHCNKEDIIIVKSPVGMPLRVLRNAFIDKLLKLGREPFSCTYHCLKTCIPANSPYCIANALTRAAEGNLDEGIITCGANAYRLKKIVPVQELLAELIDDCQRSLDENAIVSPALG